MSCRIVGRRRSSRLHADKQASTALQRWGRAATPARPRELASALAAETVPQFNCSTPTGSPPSPSACRA